MTHDLAGPPLSDVNEYGVARSLDIVAVNPYHGTQDRFDGLDSTMRGDYTRSLKKTNYLVTETNAQTIGWDSKEQFPPYDGQLRLDVYIHLSSGANMVGSSKQLGAILPLLTRMLSSSVPAFTGGMPGNTRRAPTAILAGTTALCWRIFWLSRPLWGCLQG